MNKRDRKMLDRHNASILRDRATLIVKIRALQPSLTEETLRAEAANGGNMKLQNILNCCREIDRVAIASLLPAKETER